MRPGEASPPTLANLASRTARQGRQPHGRPVSSYSSGFSQPGTRTMIELKQIDLRTDPAAQRVVKDETVEVAFAAEAGELMSLEGPNRYAAGDAIVTGSTGDRWVVSRQRFDDKYLPAAEGLAHGDAGPYRNRPAVVLAKRMEAAFSIARSENGDVLRGAAGDWVMQYAPGDYGVVQAQRFAQVYRVTQ